MDNTSITTKSVKSEKKSVFTSKIHNELRESLLSSTFIEPVHVEVHNESYWYKQRGLLGPKRHRALVVSQNKHTDMWESSIFKMKLRESDMEVVPLKESLSSHKNRWGAYRHSESGCIERDANPYERHPAGAQIDESKMLNTHFRICVISHKFDRLRNPERLDLIYSELLRLLGVNVLPNLDNGLNLRNKSSLSTVSTDIVRCKDGLGKCAPTRAKMGTIFGNNMSELQPFRFLYPDQPLTLIIEAKTPSQWRPGMYAAPISERFGSTHVGMRSNFLPKVIQPKSLTVRAKKLSQTVKKEFGAVLDLQKDNSRDNNHSSNELTRVSKSGNGERPSSAQEKSTLLDSLGLDSTVSGVKYKKQGGVYSHFFTDLPPKIKEMVMGTYIGNKVRIQKEGFIVPEIKQTKKKKVDTFQPKTGMSMLRAKLGDHKVESDYDVGSKTEEEMLEHVYITAKKIERAAIRLQRIFRIFALPVVIRRQWRIEFATLTIQRFHRGYVSRKYTVLLAKLRPIAVVQIQKRYRFYRAQIIEDRWRICAYKLTRVALPKVKLFIKNCFRSWTRRHDIKAILIQKTIRMWIFRNRLFKLICEKHIMPKFPPAAIMIQKNMRGLWGRRRSLFVIDAVLSKRIDIPAAIRLQRVYRGSVGRVIMTRKKLELKTANFLQNVCQKFVRRVWAAQVAVELHREQSATKIQRIYRGKLDRELSERRRVTRWYVKKYIPAIIKVQAYTRLMNQYRAYKILVHRHASARKIQFCWRRLIIWRKAREQWKLMRIIFLNNKAAIIQKHIRRMLARLNFSKILLLTEGKKILAAKKIMRAWVNFLYSKRLEILLDENRAKFYQEKLNGIDEIRNEVKFDQEEILVDIQLADEAIAKIKHRLNEIDTFIIESDLRIEKIQIEMSNLTPDDFERGWAEAFGSEFSMLTRQQAMGTQEMRLLRNKLMKQKAEKCRLYCELEDAELEILKLSVLETEAMEGLRRSEIWRITKRVDAKWSFLFRTEICRWKVESSRINVIRKNRPGYKEMVEKSREGRSLSYAETLSFEKRARHYDREKLTLQRLILQDGKSSETKFTTYETYGKPIQKAYDTALDNSMTLMRAFSLDERAKRIKDNFKLVEKNKVKKQGGQFAALKPEYQDRVGKSKFE
jgi:hypothetical protein